MNLVLREPWTVDRFLAWEDRQEGRHEFDGTRIIEMTGGARAHQRIVLNLASFLLAQLDPARFEVLQEMRIAAGNWVRYPDVTIAAAPIEDTQKTLRDALVVFEVLSDETAATDMNTKKDDYRLLPSIRQYIIVAQGRREVHVLRHDESGWVESRPQEAIGIAGTNVAVPLDVVYRGTRI